MFKYILLIIGLVILYKLIFGLIIPVYRTTRQIRRQFRNMNQQMNDQMNQTGEPQSANFNRQPESKPSRQDYIDFEEVK